MSRVTREDCAARDAADALAGCRARFALPAGVIYLDGNSLGPLPVATPARLAAVAQGEWGEGLIRSWNDAGWFDAPLTRRGADCAAAGGRARARWSPAIR